MGDARHGRFWGYQEAWLSLVASVFDMAIYPTLFVGYLGHLAPSVTAHGRGIWIGVALIAAASAWNLLGAKVVGGSSVLMAIVLLTPFAVLTVYAVFQRNPGAGQSIPLRSVDFLGGIAVAMWNYMGWDDASPVAGEVERPQRTYPLAMAVTCLLVAATYVLPIAAVAAHRSRCQSLDHQRLGRCRAGCLSWRMRRAVRRQWRSPSAVCWARRARSMRFTMSYSRIPAVLADDGFLPRVLGRRNRGTARRGWPSSPVPSSGRCSCNSASWN